MISNRTVVNSEPNDFIASNRSSSSRESVEQSLIEGSEESRYIYTAIQMT